MTSNMRGIALMIVAMAGFAVADTLIKLNGSVMAPAHTALYLLFGGGIIFGALAMIERAKLWDRKALEPFFLMRYGLEAGSMICMVTALTRVDLSVVGAILQATPLLVVAGAVIFLKEKVSWRRWGAIGVGFIGVLLIVEPWDAEFDANVLFALAAMVGLSGRDLTTRMVPKGVASTALAAWTMVFSLPIIAVWVALSEPVFLPTVVSWPMTIGMASFGAFGYLLLIYSTRMAPISIVSPYRYTRLIFLMLFGVLVFGERPSVSVLLGAFIIIASGIYTMWRDRVVRQASEQQA